MEVESSVSYQLASYIGEVGGIMGIFLGWSAVYFVEILISTFFKNEQSKSSLKITCMILLWITSIYWCKDAFDAYTNENESMEFSFEETSVPDLTICQPYFGWKLGDNYPCANVYELKLDFMEAIKECLRTDNSTTILNDLRSLELQDFGLPFVKSLTLSSKEGETHSLNVKQMKKAFHRKYGICYTLEAKHWDR